MAVFNHLPNTYTLENKYPFQPLETVGVSATVGQWHSWKTSIRGSVEALTQRKVTESHLPVCRQALLQCGPAEATHESWARCMRDYRTCRKASLAGNARSYFLSLLCDTHTLMNTP